MRTAPACALAFGILSLFFFAPSGRAGTWNDHFSASTLATDWSGHREDFRIVSSELDGVSASPLTPSPFNYVEVQKDTSHCSVGVWMNVVSPNYRVCTKGALLLRHSGNDGYVFALHEATQTVEVYRLGSEEMLLLRPWPIALRRWYYVRAELDGPNMSFYIDGAMVGSVNDSQSLSGAAGLAVQDAESVLFDDFTITGPNVVGNVDDLPRPALTTQPETSGAIVLRFMAEPPFDYFVQVSPSPIPSRDWTTIASFQAKIAAFEAVVTDTINPDAPRFYRVEKVPCYCR